MHQYGPANAHDTARTPAQWYCLLGGLSLLLAGILGFFVDSSFDTGDAVQGDSLIWFEVNGIHNLIHLASGLVLIAASRTRALARTVAIAFGVVYGIVAIIGIVDGSDVLGLFPVNGADHVLHVALAALGIVSGLLSRDDTRRHSDTLVDRETPPRLGRETPRERTRR
jgi:hypothetical protein